MEYEVQAFAVEPDDPDLPAGAPWLLRLDDVATRTYGFLVDAGSEVFRSTTMTPLDGLLAELAHRTVEFLRDQTQGVSLAAVLADFRRQYCADTRLDPREIIALASSVLADIARAVPSRLSPGQGKALFQELSEGQREAIVSRMVHRGVADHRAPIEDGRFLDYADPGVLRDFVSRHPELFFDGRYWSDAYEALDFGSQRVTEEARGRVLARYDGYLSDATWLATQSPADLDQADRDALIRATCSLRLLRPDTDE